jgi:hypothetical protein
MEQRQYTNEELAMHYCDIASLETISRKKLGGLFVRIRDCPVKLSEVYARDRNLKSVGSRQISNRMREVLASILEKGYEEAKRVVFEKKYPQMRKKQFNLRGSRLDDWDDGGNSWDNVVGVREGS